MHSAGKIVVTLVWDKESVLIVNSLPLGIAVKSCPLYWNIKGAWMLDFVIFIQQEKCLKCCSSMTMLGHTQVCTPQRPSQILDWQCCIMHCTVLTLHSIRLSPVQAFGKNLRIHHYVNDKALQISLCLWRQRMESKFYWVWMHALVCRWKKIVSKDGCYSVKQICLPAVLLWSYVKFSICPTCK